MNLRLLSSTSKQKVGGPNPLSRSTKLKKSDSRPPMPTVVVPIDYGQYSTNVYRNKAVVTPTFGFSKGHVKLAAADIRHLGRHDRHELDVGIEWQARHEQHGPRHVDYIHSRFNLRRAIRL